MNEKAYKRHKDSLANFSKDYIKTEIFPRALGRKIAEAEEIRHASDYDDFYIATKTEAQEQITTAEELIQVIEEYCRKCVEKRKPIQEFFLIKFSDFSDESPCRIPFPVL